MPPEKSLNIADHHAALRMACDPASPFFGMIDFQTGLLALPIPEQHRIYDSMPEDLLEMVTDYKANLAAKADKETTNACPF